MALIEGLSVSYELDEASGNAVDAHGSGIGLAAQNGPGSGVGKIGTARTFASGLSQFFLGADNAAFRTGDVDFTLAAWVFLGDKSADRTIVAKWSPTSGQSEYRLWYDATLDRFRFACYQANDVEVAVSWTAPPSLSTWYLLVARHDAAANFVSLNVDAGDPTPETGYSGTLQATGGAQFRIGARQGTSPDYWQGRIDSVRLWKRALSSSEVAALYNGGNGLAYASLYSPVPTILQAHGAFLGGGLC